MILPPRSCKVRGKICKDILYLTVSGKLSTKNKKRENSSLLRHFWDACKTSVKCKSL